MPALFRTLAALVLSLAAAPALAAGIDFSNAAYAHIAGVTSIPVGHAEFCRSHRSECGPQANPIEAQVLTEKNWTQLVAVNAAINGQVVAVTDAELYQVKEFWTYPRGYGDCEDFALAKRKALIDSGWPASTLLITVVRQMNGEGHAVLMVRSDRGDLILDNQDGSVRLWNETPYLFLKRQSQANAGQWVDIVDERPTVVAAR